MRTPIVALELQNELATQEAVRPLHNLPPHNIALYVVSDPTPVLIPYRIQLRIILGRDMSTGDFVGINLSNHHAQVLGVSRQHCSIQILDEGCVAEDLSSTNGTWVNESRLVPQLPHPLQSGDLLRLGHLMIFFSLRE